jgi:hypothetical protein
MEIKEWAKIQEEILKAQLRVVREYLSGDKPRKEREDGLGSRSKSQMSMVIDILSAAAVPLHISEIIRLAGERYGVVLDRESVVSAMIKKVKKGSTFVRTGPNTFSLKGK